MTNAAKKSLGAKLIIAGIVAPFVVGLIANSVKFQTGPLYRLQRSGFIDTLVYGLVCPIMFFVLMFLGLSLRRSASKADREE
jgi:fructose-specific phosphotransferase system IIC component